MNKEQALVEIKAANDESRTARLAKADLSGENLSGADLSGANLIGAKLSGADLSEANLSEANLSGANLRGADLSWANLRGADLSWANLREADLSEAKTDNRYYSIVGIGSRKSTTIYCVEDDFIWCGCWKGSLKEFVNRVEDVHKENKQFLIEYREAIRFFKAMKKVKQ